MDVKCYESTFFVRIFYKYLIFKIYCGERGIRTPGTSQFNGFQDRRDRPLCHLSNLLRICGCKDSTIFHKAKQLVRFLLGCRFNQQVRNYTKCLKNSFLSPLRKVGRTI